MKTQIRKLPCWLLLIAGSAVRARISGPTALQNMQEAANELQGAAADAGAKPGGELLGR